MNNNYIIIYYYYRIKELFEFDYHRTFLNHIKTWSNQIYIPPLLLLQLYLFPKAGKAGKLNTALPWHCRRLSTDADCGHSLGHSQFICNRKWVNVTLIYWNINELDSCASSAAAVDCHCTAHWVHHTQKLVHISGTFN